MYLKEISFFSKMLVLFLVIAVTSQNNYAQFPDSTSGADTIMLLENLKVQIEATEAVNDLYNFKFKSAERQFNWLKQRYPDHPLPYFLLGLSEWWKIMPNPDNEIYDEGFIAYMDSAIVKAEYRFKNDMDRVEAAFFLAAAYGFKGRLYSDRRSWGKATVAGKSALKYLDISKKSEYLSPELLFGEALYNYYSVWIPENYPALKLVLMFFEKGDKELGLQQLQEVANNAFYTRTEAQLFLMRILNNEEKRSREALPIAEYLIGTYPDNAYFHRFYARMLYSMGLRNKLEPVAKEIIARIDSGQVGYEATSGRYASFFLGEMYKVRKDKEQAKIYYLKTIQFAEDIEAFDSGYYIYALLNYGILINEEDRKTAVIYFEKVRKITKRKHSANKRATEYLKKNPKRNKN